MRAADRQKVEESEAQIFELSTTNAAAAVTVQRMRAGWQIAEAHLTFGNPPSENHNFAFPILLPFCFSLFVFVNPFLFGVCGRPPTLFALMMSVEESSLARAMECGEGICLVFATSTC